MDKGTCIGALGGCEREVYAKGLCRAHWTRSRKGLPTDSPIRGWEKNPAECMFPDRHRPCRSLGLCNTHYHQSLTMPELQPIVTRDTRWNDRTCDVQFCDMPCVHSGVCQRHASRLRYGLSSLQISAILLDASCAICNESLSEQDVHIDHDHSCCPGNARTCGECTRGILCNDCNRGLGLFQDDPGRLQAAVGYLLDS